MNPLTASLPLSLAVARRTIDAALAHAASLQVAGVAIAVVDAGANLLAFVRTDDCFLGAIDLAQRKALTAVRFRASTGALGAMSGDGPLRGIEHSHGGLVTFGGGEPLVDGDGRCVGAIGVSGGSVDEDTAIARHCRDLFQATLHSTR
ncbi:heme-binding protein [Burkholderia cenocepacia]|uniref:GlcG/HbpS family heme-binding protein n=1 Tax=Burkholderia cenocepacia TaxID=95486 RepID=UPI001B98E83C|nr:heme-binding protein [Burkholderia cenocepacia]MBR7984638.1 heme-binding protein [Burkholderia cenocepacia]